MMVSTRFICVFMPNLQKKSSMVSNYCTSPFTSLSLLHTLSAPEPSPPPSFSPYLMQQIPEYPCSDCLLSLYHEIIPNNYGPDLTLILFLLVFTSCLTILHYMSPKFDQWPYLSFYFPLFGFITNCSLLLLQVSQSLLHSTSFIFIQDQFRNC